MIDAQSMLHLIEDIKLSEGYRPAPYLCPKGKCSIGYGTNLEAHPEFIPQQFGNIIELMGHGHLAGEALRVQLVNAGMRWNESTSQAALMTVLDTCEHRLGMALPWLGDIEAARQCVLLDMSYNMGVLKLLGFKRTLAFVQSRMWEQAAAEMLESDWAHQVGARAIKLSNWMRLGEMV